MALVCLFALLAGCASIGPGTVPKDRFDYNAAVSNSWKEQTLLNILKLRYADMPLFMEVASIVAGYLLESTVTLAGTLFEGGASPDALAFGGSGKYGDHPTITYAPITGAKFNRNFLTPIRPSALLFLIQAGWPADVFLPITLEAINGLRAQRSAGGAERPDDAFVAVKYRDLWFWIDDRDFRSKRTLAYLMLLFSLTESGGKEGLPLVTIPAR